MKPGIFQHLIDDLEKFRPRKLIGRCANGYERDKGSIVHSVYGWTALCGRKPGRTSAGWSEHEELQITCPKCLRKKIEGAKKP